MWKRLLQGTFKQWQVVTASIVLVIALGLGSVVMARLSDNSRSDLSATALFETEEGPLVINVSVSGTIRSREQTVIVNEVEGQTTILWIVPEGQRVNQGDLLVELDSSSLEDSLLDQQIRVQNAEASYISSSENFSVIESQAASDVDKAELALEFAREDLRKFVEGDHPARVKELEARITLAESEYSRAQDRLHWSRQLYEKEFISQSELRADEQSEQRARLDLELAQANLDLFNRFEQDRILKQLQSDVEQAESALERTRSRARADVTQARAELIAREMEFNRQKDRLAKIEEQIEKTHIYADYDGLVVYATSVQGGFRGNQEPLQEGQTVRQRQELIHLPRADSFMAQVEIHESSLGKVEVGMPVQIAVDAIPGRRFTGRVGSIAPLPDAQSMWMNPDLKVYRTEIHITGDVSGLRTGMTCRGDIIVERHDNAVYIPVQAVVRVGGKPTVYVVTRSGHLEPREIEIGLDNNRMVHVLAGLKRGDKVSLTPPLTAGQDAEEAFDLPDDGEAIASTSGAPGAQRPRGADGETQGSRGPRPEGAEAESGQPGERTGARPDGPASEEMREEMRRRLESMSPEEREAMRQQRQNAQGGERGGITEEMRQQFESLSPEERAALRQQFQGQGGGGGGGGGGRRPGGPAAEAE